MTKCKNKIQGLQKKKKNNQKLSNNQDLIYW